MNRIKHLDERLIIDYENNKEPYKVDITQYRSTESLVNEMFRLGNMYKASTTKAEDNDKDNKVVNRPYAQIEDIADLNDDIVNLGAKLRGQQAV